jgi:hypothetical protein
MLGTFLCQSVGLLLRSEANQQTGTRELQTDLGSEDNQQTDTREVIMGYVGNTLVPVYWLAPDLRYVVNSLCQSID